jgi:hypothetical protein
MRLLIASVLLFVLARTCPGPDAADLPSAGEVVTRHLVEQNFGAYETAPWEVVCLRLHDGFQVEDEAGFLRRFDGERGPESARMPPVVRADRCEASEDDRGYRWRLDGTGKAGFLIELREVERDGPERIRIEAGASGGPIDFSLYECMLERREGRWEVERCSPFIMT